MMKFWIYENHISGWFSNRTGTSVDDDARKSNSWLDQWLNGKLGSGSRVSSFPRALSSSNDVPVVLLNLPNRTAGGGGGGGGEGERELIWRKITSVIDAPSAGFITDQFNDLLTVGLLAQLVERCTGITEVKGSNPVQAWIFLGFLFAAAKFASITVMIFFHINS